MADLNLNIDNTPPNGDDSNGQSNTDFLANIDLHDVARVFTNFTRDNRILVIPIGFPQAGKSLMLSSLMYYARRGDDTLFRTNVERDFPYNRGVLAVDDMVSFFDRGDLYDATQQGTLDLIGINISPSKAKLPQLKLAFLDLAGEDIKNIKTSERGAFTDKINAVFNGLKIDNSPVIFTLITPYEPARLSGESMQNAHDREDSLHYDFLNYIKVSQPQLLQNTKFFIIVSQWDKNPNQKENVEDFIKRYRPSIYNYVKDSGAVWGSYSVGKLLETPMSDGTVRQEIVRINYDFPSRFWAKLYHICTNKSLDGKNWFSKLFG